MLIKIGEMVTEMALGQNSVPLGLLTLIGVRDALRERNLYDTYDGKPPPAPPHTPAEYLTVRTIDGSYNDLSSPSMGMARRAGRNVPLDKGRAEEPQGCSTPIPARSATSCCSDGLQARDNLEHPGGGVAAVPDPRLVPPRHQPRSNDRGAPPGRDDWSDDPILMPSTPPDPTAPRNQSTTTFINKETHWWDASQIYGSTPSSNRRSARVRMERSRSAPMG